MQGKYGVSQLFESTWSTQLGPRLKSTIIKILTKEDNQHGGELEITNKQTVVNK